MATPSLHRALGGHHVQQVLSFLPPATNATTHFFDNAILDHFGGPVSHWSQRFYIDQRYWCGDGCPIFLYIGGEGPQGAPSDHMFISTLAQEYSALMIALEHRYYGESYPVEDMSVANLRYLNSNQALADLATFIGYVRAHVPGQDTSSTPPLELIAPAARSRWVSFGGSYPGALSAWLKLKYPASVAGAVSSSAPYHAQSNFEQYAQVGSPQLMGWLDAHIYRCHRVHSIDTHSNPTAHRSSAAHSATPPSAAHRSVSTRCVRRSLSCAGSSPPHGLLA